MKSPPLFLIAAFVVASAVELRPAEPRNLDLLKAEIRAYVNSGEYERDIAAVAAKADAWLIERAAKRSAPFDVAQGRGERLAVVFDLDETLLLNWPHIDSLDLGYTAATWEAWVAEGRAAAIEPVRAVYRTARRLGIEVIFLSGRREHQRAGTEKNVRAIGCGDFAALILKPDQWKGTAAEYKIAERRRLAAEGYTIVANLGDQESDLVGGFAERTFKLPNPLYLTP
jgi:predicted secreted acid phosphatase